MPDKPSDTAPDTSRPKKYTVSVACAEGWGSVHIGLEEGMTTVQIDEGGSVEITAVAADGVDFMQWVYEKDGDEFTSNEATFVYEDIQSDITFTAIFSKEDYTVIFEDDFEQSDAIPDPSKWMLCSKGSSAWCKHMSESYDQAYVKDGRLMLVAEKVDGQYRAGGVRMLNELGFMYGKVEVKAQFTSMAQGAWPAIWMMPAAPIWSGWPQCGEIDIMEHLNKDGNVWNVIHSHYVDNLGIKNNPVYSATPRVTTSVFNTYAIEWDEDGITFYVNDQQTLSYPNLHLSDNDVVKQWPFDTTFYLILNNALGGPGTWPGNINDSQLPSVFEIESVRVSQKHTITSAE